MYRGIRLEGWMGRDSEFCKTREKERENDRYLKQALGKTCLRSTRYTAITRSL